LDFAWIARPLQNVHVREVRCNRLPQFIAASNRKAAIVLEQMSVQMCPVVSRCHNGEPWQATPSIDRLIRDFVLGRSDGEDVLNALYDHVLDEPVPERMRALFRR
jgi:hypothetical protein